MQFWIVALKNCFDACSELDGVWIELLHDHERRAHNSTSPKCAIRCELWRPVTYTNVYPTPGLNYFFQGETFTKNGYRALYLTTQVLASQK